MNFFSFFKKFVLQIFDKKLKACTPIIFQFNAPIFVPDMAMDIYVHLGGARGHYV